MKIELHRLFLKKFKKLPKKIRSRFVERKNTFAENPRHPLLNNHSVEGRFPGCRSINVTGDYRAIFEEKENGVLFVNIGTHSEFYG